MVDSSQIQAYLKGISHRYKRWRRDNALTEAIADQQEVFTFKQFVQTEEKQSGDPLQKEIKTHPLFEGIHHYLWNKSEHVLLVGSPGVGKSSALWRCLDTLAKKELEATEPRIPVLVPLKAYRDSSISAEDPHGLLTLIQSSLRPRLRLSLPEIDTLLCNQRLILLLDGLNEIPAGVFRTHLQQFRDECRELEIPLICSTRELGGGDLGIQRKLEIQPLNSGETDRFLQECLPEHQDQVRQLLQRDNRALSRTPFVLWMLYHLLKETGTIAETLGEAFRQFFRFHCRSYKEDVPVPEERRKAWNSWMEHLAFTMLSSPDPLDPGLVITKEKAENILVDRFGELKGNGSRILELEKYYLLAPVSDRETSFKHQLIQEYYAAEGLLEKLKVEPHLLQKQAEQEYTSFQMRYLNHLKWTEPLLMVMALLNSPTSRLRDPQGAAIRISKLALITDLRLGSRIIGATSKLLQEHTVKLLLEKDFQDSLKIWLLQQSKSTEGIPFLLNILHNGDSSHRWRAARALAKFDKNLVKDHLLQALRDSDASVRRMAAASLKELGGADIAAHLCRLLHNDNDWLVLSFVVDYLGELEGKEAIDCLKNAIQHPEPTVRKKAVEHLGRRSPSQTIALLEKQLRQEDIEPRKKAVDLLGETKVPFAFSLLKGVLLENDWTLRSSAISSIGALGIWLNNFPKDIIKELVNILHHDPHPCVRSCAALYLGVSGTTIAMEALRDSLSNEEDITVCRSSIDALGRIGDSSVTDDLLARLNQANNKNIENTLRSLRLIKAIKALPKIRKYLTDKDPKLRKEATLSIGYFGDPQKDLPFLYKLLKDKNFSVRLCSAYALSQFGNRKGIPILKEALETGNKDARKRAFYGIQNFNGKVELSTVTSIAIKDEEYSLRKEAIKFLKNFSHMQEVRERLNRGLKSDDETIARQAMDAAKVLGHPEILECLNQISKEILVVERPLEAIQEIQSRCGFYSLPIQQKANQEHEQSLMAGEISQSLSTELLVRIDQSTQEIDKRTLQMSNEPKNDFSGANFHAPVNFGDNPTGDFIRTQNNFHTDAEVQNVVSDLKILLTQLQDQYPSVKTESEALAIIDAEFTEIRTSQNHKLAILQKQLLNPERHLQACKAAAGEVAKHYLEDSVWAKTIITYIDKLSEEPGCGA